MKLNHLSAIFVLVLLTACATLNVPAPSTFNQKVYAAYKSEDAAVQTVTTLYSAGKISKEQAQKFHDRAVELKDGIGIADRVHTSDPTAGDDKLAAAIAALTALQSELQARK